MVAQAPILVPGARLPILRSCLPNSGGAPPGDDAEPPGGKRPTHACGATWLPMAGGVAPDGTMPDSRLRDARLPIPGGARPEGGRRGSRWWTFPSITIAGASTSSFAISEATMSRSASIIRSCNSRSKSANERGPLFDFSPSFSRNSRNFSRGAGPVSRGTLVANFTLVAPFGVVMHRRTLVPSRKFPRFPRQGRIYTLRSVLEAPPGRLGCRLVLDEAGADAVVAVHSRDEHFPRRQRVHGSEARIAGDGDREPAPERPIEMKNRIVDTDCVHVTRAVSADAGTPQFA